MKPLAVILFALTFLFTLPCGEVAEAATTPHIVADGDVWLLDADGVRLFLIPDSYYARINNLDESYYYVTFNGVSGKVSKNEVSTVGYHTVSSGTMRDIRISESFAEFTAINLKRSPDLGAEASAEVPTDATITFLGVYPTDGGLWYYVRYEQFTGYIRAERTTMTTPIIAAFVPEKLPENTAAAVEPESTYNSDDNNNILESNELKIVIIVGLAIPAVAIVLLLFRPGRKKEKYYEE